MAWLPGRRSLYQHLVQVERDYDSLLDLPIQSIRNLLIAYAGGGDNPIPRQSADAVRDEAGRIIETVFTGGNRQAYRNDVEPLSTFTRMLNKHLTLVQQDAVQGHTQYIRAALKNEPDLLNWLVSWSQGANENPLPTYEPAHLWIDPNGYRLSDRIWQTGQRTRQRLDLLLTEGIQRQHSAVRIAKLAEQFLRPSRADIRTKKPYGKDGSFDAMRLARTEITRAHSQVTSIASQQNPYVEGIDWALSASHPKFDICDGLATIGKSGNRIKEPYDKRGAYPLPVVSSHPQCLCHIRPYVSATPAQVTAQLRAQFQAGSRPPLTPVAGGVDGQGFMLLLLGSYLLYEVRRGV